MIIVRLEGGLGNQLFQYAFGRALSSKYDTKLYMDTIAFDTWQPNAYSSKRDFQLEIFSLRADLLASQQRSFFFPTNSLFSRAWHKIKRIVGAYSKLYERRLGFDKLIFNESSKNCYCIGYWQSVFYFDSIGTLLANEITPRLAECKRDIELEDEIEKKKPICIHVRRGDYVSNAITTKVHGIITMEYYKKAVAILESKIVEKPEYYIFSDDPHWCSQAFDWLPTGKVVSTPSYNHSAYDMYLMSCCSHFIIANSSFSWWAAWLSKSSGKKVIAPQQWFAETTSDELQMHPKDWIIL